MTTLNALSCPAVGACVAAGTFNPGSGFRPILIERQHGRRWTAHEAPLPSDASTPPGGEVNAISCPTKRSCVAVGDYETENGHVGLIETLTGHSWSAVAAPLPGPADATPFGSLSAVSCSSVSDCVAVGNYEDANGVGQGVIETLAGGSWVAALPSLPAGADAGAGGPLSNLSCPSPDDCVAAGKYGDATGPRHGYAETLSDGEWSPSDVAVVGDGTGSFDWSDLSCAAAGVCVGPVTAVGTDDEFHFGIESLSGGGWTQMPAPLPDGVDPSTHVALVEHIACGAPSFCTGSGVVATAPNDLGTGLVAIGSGSSWSSFEPPLPSNAEDNDHTSLGGVSCVGQAFCLVVGNYSDTQGDQRGLIVTVPDPQS